MRDVKEAKVLETDDEGRGSRVEYRAAALGKSIRYVLEYDYSEAPDAFSWQFVEGDMLRRLDGTYRFEAEGPDSTRVHYECSKPSLSETDGWYIDGSVMPEWRQQKKNSYGVVVAAEVAAGPNDKCYKRWTRLTSIETAWKQAFP